MTVNVPVTQEIPIEESCLILGLGPDISDSTSVLLNFKKIWDDNPEVENLILAKHTLLRHIVCQEMKEQRYFSIVSPFEKSCILCRGAGEIYKFDKHLVDVNCPVCAGKKEVDNAKCSRCIGTGKIKRAFLTHTMKSTTPCKQCNELGFIIPKSFTKKPYKAPRLAVTVFSREIAKTLSQLIKK